MKTFHFILFTSLLLISCSQHVPTDLPSATVMADADTLLQKIDGFGVNITPAQWRGGNLKPVLDMLVNDLGAKLFRFDCYGLADWLDPEERNEKGKYPPEYLEKIYTSAVFTDAWETFRYLNALGIEPHFNVSGRIPPTLGFAENPKELSDFDGYAEMVVSMLWWAREKEHLQFSVLSPFNETDLSCPEGPGLRPDNIPPAVSAVVRKLNEYGLGDIRLIVMDDAAVDINRMQPLLQEASFTGKIKAFGFHTYGNGGESEPPCNWFTSPTPLKQMAEQINKSIYRNTPLWLTEYGDLDQTGLIEYEFAWRSTRRLIKALNDGFSAGIAWDAYDNFHLHDTAWALYGLLETDTIHWKYTPRPRYYTAKHLFRHVLPGFFKIALTPVDTEKKSDIYKIWHDPLRHIRMVAFTSPDRVHFTLVGMNLIEKDFRLKIELKGFNFHSGQKLYYYVTSPEKNYERMKSVSVKNNCAEIILNGKCIFTLTSIP